jgi:CRISPR/Cas system-associated exonuclease Cas4 (RecB family)
MKSYPLLPTPYSLPPTPFQFSQSSLSDFTVCPRRFELRYLQRLAWPAVESEPVHEAERLAQLGADFHRLVQQHLAGVEPTVLSASLAERDPDLQQWWQNYLNDRPQELAGAQLYPELPLSTPLRGYRLLARFDLLAVQPDGTFLIVDWKTSLRQPRRDELARRLQTRVYPYVLAQAGAALNNGQSIDPAKIQMLYWYPAAPGEPERFAYSAQLLSRDELYLSELLEQIKTSAKNGHFPLVEEVQACTYCVYRSFCDRGEKGGPLAELTDESQEAFDVSALDWEQIAEIQF